MNPNPSKRPRRSDSPPHPPISPTDSSLRTTASRPPNLPPTHPSSSASPSHPVLPPPIPSFPGPGPSTWQSWERAAVAARPASRRSMDARSPSNVSSPRMEGIEEQGSEAGGSSVGGGGGGGLGVTFARDTSGRAPRSMMACTRCRRQKMKCDGPSQVPCRGCRQANQPCIFEARSRPKSISAIPSRPPPFFAGALQQTQARPPTPTGFYSAAPPVTSRGVPPPSGPPLTSEPYALRQAREPMPPPPSTSISVLTSPFPPPPRPHSPPPIQATYHPGPPPPPPPPLAAPPPQPYPPPPASAVDLPDRLRSIEVSLRPLVAVPQSLSLIHQALASLQRSTDILASALPSAAAARREREAPEAQELIWENYRSRAWPLTPWLVGLREATGVSGSVVGWLGRKAVIDGRASPGTRERDEVDDREREVRREIGRLMSGGVGGWTREEVRAIGVYATWCNDSALASLGVAQARLLGLDNIFGARKTHDDWREWIYLTIMDHLSQIPDYHPPSTLPPLSPSWRDRLQTSSSPDPAVRDRDLKLLAWLEYAETLGDVLRGQILSSAGTISPPPTSSSPSAPTAETKESDDVRRGMESWRRWAARWDAWAGGWQARSDPILSLHFNYAVLFTASPAFLAAVGAGMWAEMAARPEGFAQLERARDAALAVVQAICSPELSRTLPYSLALYRPILGLALVHLLCMTGALTPSSPLISHAHVLAILRSAGDALAQAGHDVAGSILGDVVLGGADVGSAGVGREVLGLELGREAWRRVLG